MVTASCPSSASLCFCVESSVSLLSVVSLSFWAVSFLGLPRPFASLVGHLEMCWCAPLHTLDPLQARIWPLFERWDVTAGRRSRCHPSNRPSVPPSWLSRRVFKQCRGRYPVDPLRRPSRRSMFARYRWSGLVRPPPSAVAVCEIMRCCALYEATPISVSPVASRFHRSQV